MMNLKRAVLALALGAGCVGLMIKAAEAAPQTVLSAPVSACVNGGHTGTLAYEWDGLFNKSTSQAMHLDCSLPSSTQAIGETPRLHYMYLVVRDGHSSDNITCGMKVISPQGYVVFEGVPDGTTGTGQQAVSFTVPSGVAGAAYASCRLPPKQGSTMSGIVSVMTDGSTGP